MKAKTNIGLTEKQRSGIAAELSKLLADEYVLYTKTRNAHWNVVGSDFHTAHVFFETQYDQLATILDDVAERIRQLGHYAPATLKEFLELTHLSEKITGKNTSLNYMKELLADYDAIIVFIRTCIEKFDNELNDPITSDFVTGIAEIHEKTAWMLRAHIE
jgi:starvation-inducible DNA-binding protein